jgi:excisionase family DNA binding protein
MLVGTGGAANAAVIAHVPSSNGLELKVYDAAQSGSRLEIPLLPAEQLAAVRRYLSLSVTEMADVLRVGRPTVYSWLRDESTPHATNLARIQRLYRIARSWRMVSSSPVGAFRNAELPDGSKLMDQLVRETLDERVIQGIFSRITAAMSTTSRRQSIAETAQSKGMRPVQRDVKKWTEDELLNL